MKKLIVLTFGLSLMGFAASAQTTVSDTDGNGTFSIEEMTATYPDMTPALFSEIDVDGSGAIDADELQAARENGQIN